MTHIYRSSGLPWTSKGFQVEPKLFIKIKPLAIQSQKGYKIRTRCLSLLKFINFRFTFTELTILILNIFVQFSSNVTLWVHNLTFISMTRSEQQYSCADRPRDQIFKDNYDRRQFQVHFHLFHSIGWFLTSPPSTSANFTVI